MPAIEATLMLAPCNWPCCSSLTRLVNTALDGVATELDAVFDDIVKYAGTDLLCYRAENPDKPLYAVIDEMCARAAKIWKIDVQVEIDPDRLQ